MAKYETLIELNPEKAETISEYISYCKFYFKPKGKEKIKDYNSTIALKKDFPCVNRDIMNESKYKSNETLKDFPLSWLKNEIIKERKTIAFNNDKNVQTIKQISGIYTDIENLQNLQNYINELPKYSFAIWFRFELKAPYFSKDDDEFYIIQNPVLKETNFKAPMVRGSGWKGALANAFRKLFKEDEDNREKIESFLRIFGAGSEAIKTIESYIKGKNTDGMQNKLLEFILFELGLKVDKELITIVKSIKDKNEFKSFLKEILSKKLEAEQSDLPIEFQTHKGRAIFYPTYFNSLSLEVINPHDRRKRAGTNPIHYEVVPEGTEGIFQLIYVPFDGIVKSDEKLKDEAEEDLKNLCSALEILQNLGIGAKTKLGWGRFILEKRNKKCFLNFKLDNKDKEELKRWEIIESSN